jgi:transcriptional regulator with XRE-family HTH domain
MLCANVGKFVSLSRLGLHLLGDMGRMAEPQARDPRDEIARRLDDLREAKGLSMSELGTMAGVKIGVLSNLHTGRRKGRSMKLGVAAQLCQALGAKVGRDLLGEEELPLPSGLDLAQMTRTEKDNLIIRLMAELLRLGHPMPPTLVPRRDDDADETERRPRARAASRSRGRGRGSPGAGIV